MQEALAVGDVNSPAALEAAASVGTASTSFATMPLPAALRGPGATLFAVKGSEDYVAQVGTVEVLLDANRSARRGFWALQILDGLLGGVGGDELPYDVVVRKIDETRTVYREGPYDASVAVDVFQDFVRQIGSMGIAEFLFRKENRWRIE